MSARQKIKAFSFAGSLSLNVLLAILLVISAKTQARVAEVKNEKSTRICLSALQMLHPMPVDAVIPSVAQPEKSPAIKQVEKSMVKPMLKPAKKQVVKKKITPAERAPRKTARAKAVKPVGKPVPAAKQAAPEPRQAAAAVLPNPAMARQEAAVRAARRTEKQRQCLVAELIQRLEKEKKFPALAVRLGVSGTVLLLIEVRPDGVISHYEVVEKQSAHNILQKAALATVRKAAAKPLAMDDLEHSLRVKVPVVYELI